MNYVLGKRLGGVFLAFFILYFLFLIPLPVDAQGLLPCKGADCTVTDLFELGATIFNWLLGLAAVVAVLFIILAAVRMLTHSWSGSAETTLGEAKKALAQAVTGFIVVAVAFLLVNTLLIVLGGDNCLLTDPLVFLGGQAGPCL